MPENSTNHIVETASRQRRGAASEFFHETLDQRLDPARQAAAGDRVLALFRETARSVPAYREFLAEYGVDPSRVETLADFSALPPVTKDNYLRRHRLSDLCRGGRLPACDMIAVSSGSTGQPGFWPRCVTDEYDIATRFEQVFRDGFSAEGRSTLAVVCFALGTWVGGIYTADCLRHLAVKGYPLTVITPGNNKEEIFRVVEALAPHFEQVVLAGYPPFIKDVIDSGIVRGLDWRQRPIRLVFAGEVFSEEWRSLVLERVGAHSPGYDSASLYGTADGGVLGNETPLSITIRRWFARHPQAARERFGGSRLPTLVQYDPCSRYFEEQDGTLIFSGDNGIPLIRYHLCDEGGLSGFADMLDYLRQQGFDPFAELGAGARGARELPFVHVFGRSHFVLSYFGANIYPENVTVGLEQRGVREWVTGRFVMEIREDADRNRFLHVVVELAPGESAGDERSARVAQSIRQELSRLNSEFANYVPPEYQPPLVDLRPAGDPEWFPPGGKHRYARR